MAKDAVTHDLSPRQIELLICSLVDLEKFAKLGQFATRESARVQLSTLLKKVMESGAVATTEGDGGDGAEWVKETPKKRGRKVTKEDGDDDEGTPAKKTKATPKRGKKVTKAKEGEDREESVKVKDEDGDGEEDEEA
ncbi:hypothetical protein LTR95_002288 [Oleoguttula sp. CCFEE 5521]